MKRLILAIQLMTRLPLPAVPASEIDFAASIRWFPATGLVVGGAVAAGSWVGLLVDPWVAALLALLAWVGITGALHLDGLGDIADAAGAAHQDREKLSLVLADPHIGGFGVVAIALQIAAKLILLTLLLEGGMPWVLVAIPMLARVGPLVWAITMPPLHEGLGSRFRSGAGWAHVAIWSLVALVPMIFVPVLTLTIPLIVLWRYWLIRRIGGISGDGHGAGIELVESGLLLAVVAAA